jgi:hypothetical protein
MMKNEKIIYYLGLNIFKTSNFRVLHDMGNVMKELEMFIIENYALIKK